MYLTVKYLKSYRHNKNIIIKNTNLHGLFFAPVLQLSSER